MSLDATISIDITASKAVTSGLTSAIDQHPMRLSVDVGDCTKVWSDRRTVGAAGYDDIDFSAIGISAIKLLYIRNLATSDIGLSAGLALSEFRNFMIDALAWDFSPMINIGGPRLRGLPIRAGGVYMVSCPNSSGFQTPPGASLFRIGGQSGASYEIYVLGN